MQAVVNGSPAAQVGLRENDTIQTLNLRSVYSYADAQYALHHAPIDGDVEITWTRGGEDKHGIMRLRPGWRKTDLTWRPSMLDLLPNLAVSGQDLSAQEKLSIGLDEKQLAFRQSASVHSEAQAIGIHAGDVILGVDGLAMKMSADAFRAYVRRNSCRRSRDDSCAARRQKDRFDNEAALTPRRAGA